MRIPCEVSAGPVTNFEWWTAHVSYSKFRRQGIDIVCASFKHKNAKANLVFVTGLMESFIKYSETIQYFYERGFSVFTYDHQSQGLSGRCEWLIELAALLLVTSPVTNSTSYQGCPNLSPCGSTVLMTTWMTSSTS
jgi:alpha-beta hydrolase superfamily lysophospholipase